MRFSPLLLALALPGSSATLSAQQIEDPGPHLVGWRDVQFTDANFGRGEIRGRMFYPALQAGQGTAADPAYGPYPLVGFQHGWLGRPDMYDELCTHLASWGFVVASIGTQTGIFATMQAEALDTRSLLHWVDDESAATGAWLEGMAWDGDWSASGHSMGGGALMYLIGIEPRVRAVVPLQPYAGTGLGGSAQGFQNLAVFTGSVSIVTGELDDLVDEGLEYFQNAPAARRDLYSMVLGMGHLGPTDNPPNNEPLSAAEQHRLHRRILAGTLRAEMRGEENLYVELLGEGIVSEPVQFLSLTSLPPLWAVESRFQAGALAVGMAGMPGDRVLMARSFTAASKSTPYGVLGLDPRDGAIFYSSTMPGSGVRETVLPLQGSWSGRTLYIQGLRLGPGVGALSRTAAVAVP
ncbi:MAG: hypothetical protein EYC70_02775 [Planctomycetota bacterium]|nr:MAG: hypothetical protein EYC70_02775 [Planctomycetota bacterium]